MADEIKSVILDVQLDTGDSARKAAELRDEIIKLKEAQKENKRETQAQKDLYEATDASIKSHTERLNLLTQSIKNQETATKSNNGSFNQLQASLKVGEATLKQLTGTITRNADGVITLSKEYFDAKKDVDNAKNALLLFNAGISQGNLNVGNYDNTLSGMRQKLADLQNVIQNTDIGSKQFKEAQVEADKLIISVGQLEGKIDAAGNREGKNSLKDGFQDAQGAAQALTGAVGVLSLAMGTDSKAGEALRKVTIGLSIAQTALTIAKSKGDIQGTIGLVTTKAQVLWQNIYTFAIGKSTGALKVFRTALLTTGIGAVIAGIALLITRMNRLKDSTEDEADAQQRLNDKIKEAQQLELKFANSLAERSKVLERNLSLRQAEGASEKELYDLKKKINDAEIIGLQQAMLGNIELAEKIKFQERIYDVQNDNKVLDASYSKQVIDNSKKIQEEKQKEIDLLTDAFDDYLNGLIDAENEAKSKRTMTAWEFYQRDLALLKSQKEGTVKVYDAMGEEIVASEDDSNEMILASTKKLLEDKKELLIADNEAQTELITAFATDVGNIFADSLTQAGLDLKKFSSGVAILLVETLEKALIAAQVQILAKEIASKSFAGIATSAILIGLITAASAGVKAALTQESKAEFYEGGYTGEGNPRDESNKLGKKNYIYHKDEYVVPSKVLNDPQGINLVEKLEQMRKNNPFRIGGIGKADGGFAYNFSNAIKQQQSISAADFAKIKLFVRVTDIDSGLKSIEANNSVKVL